MQGLSTRPPLFWNYTRYSTPPQQWGDSDRRQLVEGRHRADALQMTFVDSYRDLGISAYHSRNRTNGALGQFLADLRSPPRVDPWPMPGDVLHCENFDRLSRADPEDSLKLFMEIIESGIILMVRDQQYTRDVMRRERWRWQQVLSELIRAHEESFWKSDRGRKTNDGKREAARDRRKAFVGNRCPAWLRPIEKPVAGQWPLYELIPERCNLRQAWEMYDAGNGSNKIAAHFNATGVRVLAKRIRAKETQGWTAQLVRQMLVNVAAMGVYQPKMLKDGRRVIEADCDPIEGYYPALVNEGLFLRVRTALKEAGKTGSNKGPHGQHYANLFKGLCQCGSNTNHAVNIGYRSKEGLGYLRCDQSRHANCENKASFQYEKFESMVLGMAGVGMGRILADLMPNPARDPRHQRVAELEAMIPSKEEQLQAIWTRWLNPEASGSESMRLRAEQQLERIDGEIAANKAELIELRQELRIAAAHDDDGFYQRLKEAKGQLVSADDEARYEIRKRLAQEFRRRIDRVTLYDDGTITMRIRERRGLGAVDVRYTGEGVRNINVIGQDGTVLTSFDLVSMALLESIETQAA
jgi:Resolvase, N terminal domain/Recombinase